ncbi:Cytochrome P450 [Quillaja saponaria]|uniref:Cytochrome P450 n=1 Tax=Quillaja saponaria TaxID=32244 RepID=A0AAD7PAH3_QUISA|nr:Cytochrome P450 [Quillaja saponaria]
MISDSVPLVGTVVMNLSFSSLASDSYSNPTTTTTSLPCPQPQLPIIGHMHLLGPTIHQSLHRLSLRYGPFFSLRFGSVPCVVASTPHFAKQLLQTNELSFISRIQSAAIKRLTYDSSLAFAPYGPYWKFIKKLCMNDLLGARTVNNFRHVRAQEYIRLLRLLAHKSEVGEAVNLTEELLKLTNNVISRMMLGQAEEARDVVREVTKIFGEYNVSDFIWVFKKFDLQGLGKRIESIFERFDTLVERIMNEREQVRKIRKNKENGELGENGKIDDEIKDFLDVLLDYTEDESLEIKITRTHIKALIMDFFTAGTDTTAIATEWALVELINRPNVLEKARHEIDKIVGMSRLVEESDVPSLPYIQAIVKETLRLHPPVPLVTRRCVEQCKIENYVIPANTLLLVNVWAIGRDPNNWESPMDFRPERFLNSNEGGGPLDVRGQHFQLLPFGSGRRICPGITLAMLQVPALLAAIIQCFDFQVVGPKGEKLSPGDTVPMEERPGLTAPRAKDLVCFPVTRYSPPQTMGQSKAHSAI